MILEDEFLLILKYIKNHLSVPPISNIFIPKKEKTGKSKGSNFGAIFLEDGSVGLFYLALDPQFDIPLSSTSKLIGSESLSLAKKFKSTDPVEKTLGLGTISAISQYIFKHAEYSFDFALDTLDLIDIQKDDIIGMVGFFPPLVKKIENLDNPLIVLELKSSLVKKTKNWEVTLDPGKLRDCTKILCTATTLLNNTLNRVLYQAPSAKVFSVIGPTAGFFPDPLFKLGVTVVGGTVVQDSSLFLERLSRKERWRESVKKYVIQKEKYIGFKEIIKSIT